MVLVTPMSLFKRARLHVCKYGPYLIWFLVSPISAIKFRNALVVAMSWRNINDRVNKHSRKDKRTYEIILWHGILLCFGGNYNGSLQRMQKLTLCVSNSSYRESKRNKNPIFVLYMLKFEFAFFETENYSFNTAWGWTHKFESKEPFWCSNHFKCISSIHYQQLLLNKHIKTKVLLLYLLYRSRMCSSKMDCLWPLEKQ